MSDIKERAIKIIIEYLDVEAEKVNEEAHFVNDLGADSLEIVEVVMALEDEFDVEIEDDVAANIQTVNDAIDFIKKATA